MCFSCSSLHALEVQVTLVVKALDSGDFLEATCQLLELDNRLSQFKRSRDRNGVCVEARSTLSTFLVSEDTCPVGRVLASIALAAEPLNDTAPSA